VPIEKFQRMLQSKTKGFGEGNKDESTKVPFPPPGEREKSTKKRNHFKRLK
jgi:hypothetical protein